MSSSIIIRPARRYDVPALAQLANAANAHSAIHRRMAPYQDQYPIDYYRWRLNIMRLRLATADQRTLVAEDTSTGQVLGLATWGVEGSETALYKEWIQERSWSQWLEAKLIWVERTWCRYVADKSIDYEFLSRFLDVMDGADHPARPACLHCRLIVVQPQTQSRGVGRMLIGWGKELAVKQGLPLYLESNLEATGFYEKTGFSRLTEDFVVSLHGQEPFHVPVYVWEGREREGRWLEHDKGFDGEEKRWRWRDDVVSK